MGVIKKRNPVVLIWMELFLLLHCRGEDTPGGLTSSSAHPEPDYEGTPTDYCKDQTVFYAGAAHFLFVL